MSPLRVLMLAAYPAIGGPLPKLAPLVSDGLRQSGCEVRTEGWSAHRPGRERLPAKVIGRAADLARVHSRIRTWKPHVIYVVTAHTWPGLLRDLSLALTVRRGRPPMVLHMHGGMCDRLGQPGQWLFTRLSILLARRSASVMLLSSEELRTWQRVSPQATFEVVANPMVVSRADQGPQQPSRGGHEARVATLLTVARLIPEKGVFDLLDALAIVRQSRRCHLLVAGTGPEHNNLVRRIKALRLGDAVEMLGYVSGEQLEEAYRRADLFVLPTYFAEGFPLSIMEAMSYGLPVVTTKIRGSADQLADGENALFVPPRNPRVLAKTIEDLLDDDGLRNRMAQANFTRIADFAPERVIPQYVEVLRRAAVRPNPRVAR